MSTSQQKSYLKRSCPGHQLYSLALPVLFLLRLHKRAHPHVTVVSQLGMMSMLKNEACHRGTYRGKGEAIILPSGLSWLILSVTT